jgi:uncharacterized coiled-coil DUF342 family protein
MDQKLTAIRAGLLEHCIEVQALANKMLNTTCEHRDQAREVKTKAFELSKLLRKLTPLPNELHSLDTFFPTGHGRKADEGKFVHLED